jgi:hypothetical protein
MVLQNLSPTDAQNADPKKSRRNLLEKEYFRVK